MQQRAKKRVITLVSPAKLSGERTPVRCTTFANFLPCIRQRPYSPVAKVLLPAIKAVNSSAKPCQNLPLAPLFGATSLAIFRRRVGLVQCIHLALGLLRPKGRPFDSMQNLLNCIENLKSVHFKASLSQVLFKFIEIGEKWQSAITLTLSSRRGFAIRRLGATGAAGRSGRSWRCMAECSQVLAKKFLRRRVCICAMCDARAAVVTIAHCMKGKLEVKCTRLLRM